MTKKINVFTFLIFAYSVVICLTCKRDFSEDVSQKVEIKQEKPTYNYLVASGDKPLSAPPSMKIKAARN